MEELGETEIREAHLFKAEYLCRIGDKEAAETAFRVTTEKTVSLGQRLDIVLNLIRLGMFYSDKVRSSFRLRRLLLSTVPPRT